MEKYYKYKIVSIDAWRDESGWYWNDSYETDVGKLRSRMLPESMLSSNRKLLKFMRDIGCLSDYSKGRVRVDSYDGSIIEFQDKNTFEPHFALMLEID